MGSQVSLLTYKKGGRTGHEDSLRSSKKRESQYRYSIMSPVSPAEYLSPTGVFNANEMGTQLNCGPINPLIYSPGGSPFNGAGAYAKFNYTGWNTQDGTAQTIGNGI